VNYRRFGRTQLQVSRMGLGSGGHNPFGQKTGIAEAEIHRLIQRALDLGINYFDTAPPPTYLESESILGRALRKTPRHRYIISTKVTLVDAEDPNKLMAPEEIEQSIDASLRRLGLEYIDIILLGGAVTPAVYAKIANELVPVLQRLRQQGKFRFLGATEKSALDGAHEWLQKGLGDNLFDVVMVAYNLINQSAERLVFPLCQQNDVGVINIFTVRNVFSRPQRLSEVIADLIDRGLVAPNAVPPADPLGWLLDGEGDSLVSAAYRFAAGSSAVSTVMTGTLNIAHLEDNIRKIELPPLSPEKMKRLRELFGKIAEPIGN
jgi:L-galactose dehydrogenase